jgi:hypothetical protein
VLFNIETVCNLPYQSRNLLSFYVYVFNDVVFHVKQFDDIMLNTIPFDDVMLNAIS